MEFDEDTESNMLMYYGTSNKIEEAYFSFIQKIDCPNCPRGKKNIYPCFH